jgi:hypothetical protein
VRVTNLTGISLPLAVWLLHDEYDFVTGVDNYISVTTLMKPLRQIVLPHRIPMDERSADVEEFIARRLGHAIHDSIEHSWRVGHERAMKLLGYPQHLIDRVKINPTDDEVRSSNEIIPVYLEQRGLRDIAGFTIGGKFDMVADGRVEDFKSTSAWGWAKGTKDDDHRLQMSLYRWIDAGREVRRITENVGRINFIFTDWQKNLARSNANYPQKRVESKDIPLLSLEETERWARNKLALVREHWNTPEDQLPECTDEELWRGDPVYKYFSDPAKASVPGARSTRNFSDLAQARQFQAEKGGRGIIITQLGEPKACGYCPAFDACTQKDRYL